MALVANPLPSDTMTIGKTVAYFDPTADMAGLKYGDIVDVQWGVSGTDKPLNITVRPKGVVGSGSDITAEAKFFRVVDELIPQTRPNV